MRVLLRSVVAGEQRRSATALVGFLRLNGYVVAALIAFGSICGRSALHAQGGAAAAGPKATIGIRAVVTRASGRGGGTSASEDLSPGQSHRLHLTVGDGDNLCVSSVWHSQPGVAPPTGLQAFAAEREVNALYVWRFDISAVEVMTDKVTFDLAWQRTSRAGLPPLSQEQRLTVREGEARPIDLIHGRPGSDCVSLVVEVTAGIVEDPAMVGKTVEWDLWFGGGSDGKTVHKTLTSAQGESAAFHFDAVPSTATQLNAQVDDVWVDIYGQLRGRMRSDGRLDVAVSTERSVSRIRRAITSAPRGLAPAGGSGQKNFTMQPGEAVKIVLPPIGSPGNRPDSGAEMSLTVRARVR